MFFSSDCFLIASIIAVGIAWSGALWWRKWRKMPPGPYGIPFFGYLPFMAWSRPPLYMHLFRTIHEKYGPIVSLTGFQDMVFVSDSEMIKELLKKDELLLRPDHRILSGGGGHIHGHGKRWLENRKFAVSFFREHLFKDTEKLNKLTMQSVQEALDVFCRNLDRPFDLGITLNVCIVKMLFSVVVRKTNFSSLCPFIVKKTFEAVSKSEELLLHMWFSWLSPLYWKNTSALDEMTDWLNHLILQDIETERHEASSDSYVGQYLEGISGRTDQCFTERELLLNVRSLFAAGTETTATSLKWAIKHLMDNPEVQRRCQQEVDGVIGQERLPHIDDLPHLPYLNAFIEENFRLSPVLPMIIRQTTTDFYFRGYLIPQRTWCFANVLTCQRDEALFLDPDVFKPERFLDSNSEFVMPQQGMTTFGTGKRRCFGEKLARVQVGLFLATFIQKFQFLQHVPRQTIFKPKNSGVNHPPPFQVIIRSRTGSS